MVDIEERSREALRAYSVLWVSTRSTPDGVIVQPYGEIDLATVGDLEDALHAAERSGATRIVVDLARVSVLDSSGLRCLVVTYERLRKQGRRLEIQPGTRRIRRLFEIAGLIHRLGLPP